VGGVISTRFINSWGQTGSKIVPDAYLDVSTVINKIDPAIVKVTCDIQESVGNTVDSLLTLDFSGIVRDIEPNINESLRAVDSLTTTMDRIRTNVSRLIETVNTTKIDVQTLVDGIMFVTSCFRTASQPCNI
jgi:hypothetical protein